MEVKLCLNNKDEYPDDAVLAHHLGDVKEAWDVFMAMLKKEYPLIQSEWRYYKDGKSWLCKVTKKKKTICWVGVSENMFRTTFYLTDKAADLVDGSQLDQKYKDQFKNGKYYGKIKGISIEVQTPADLKMTKMLIDIKEQMK